MVSGCLNSCRTAAFIASARSSRLGGAPEKFHRTAYALAQSMGTREDNGPVPNDRVVEPFHEFCKVNDRKISRDLAALLPFSKDFSQQADRDFLGLAHVGRPHWIHRS